MYVRKLNRTRFPTVLFLDVDYGLLDRLIFTPISSWYSQMNETLPQLTHRFITTVETCFSWGPQVHGLRLWPQGIIYERKSPLFFNGRGLVCKDETSKGNDMQTKVLGLLKIDSWFVNYSWIIQDWQEMYQLCQYKEFLLILLLEREFLEYLSLNFFFIMNVTFNIQWPYLQT